MVLRYNAHSAVKRLLESYILTWLTMWIRYTRRVICSERSNHWLSQTRKKLNKCLTNSVLLFADEAFSNCSFDSGSRLFEIWVWFTSSLYHIWHEDLLNSARVDSGKIAYWLLSDIRIFNLTVLWLCSSRGIAAVFKTFAINLFYKSIFYHYAYYFIFFFIFSFESFYIDLRIPSTATKNVLPTYINT